MEEHILFIVYWGNGFIAAFDSEDFEQEFNTPASLFGSDLKRVWDRENYDSIRITTYERIQLMREANGHKRKPAV